MKGLLIKDVQLIFANKQVFLILIFVGILQLTSNDNNYYFAVSYFTFMMGMVGISTISYDEFEDGTQFLLTLPITRKLYAMSKYAVLCLLSFVGWLFPVCLGLVTTINSGVEVDWPDWWMARVLIWIAINLILMITLPVQIKFGSTHGRLVLLAATALIVLVPVLGSKVLASAGVDAAGVMMRLTEIMSNLNPAIFVAGIIALFLITLAISLFVSIHVMEKKQF